MKRFLASLYCLLQTTWACSQVENQAIDALTLLSDNGQVHLRWTMKAGNTCNGIKIYRAVDARAFENIAIISGVCGSTFEDVLYEYRDSLPAINQRNYYYVALGELGNSAIVSIDVLNFSNNGVIIRRAHDGASIEFALLNPTLQEGTFRLIKPGGEIEFEQSGAINKVFIQADLLSSGLHIFQFNLSDGSARFMGKFVKTE